jgi:pimeloyl-ACP methyl ester carboxylesterase
LSETVLLLHGLLMRRPALLPLAHRLRGFGYTPRLFGYSSLFDAPEATIDALAERLYALGKEGPVHVVAHSLGGLVAIEAFNRHAGLPDGRIVCLGSPLAGSAAARGLLQRRLGTLSGRSGPLLRAGLTRLPYGREIGMVAGSRPMGLGRFFGRLQGDNDGTVAVEETRVPGLAAHAIVPVSHSGLVFSAPAAALVRQFLGDGRMGPGGVRSG